MNTYLLTTLLPILVPLFLVLRLLSCWSFESVSMTSARSDSPVLPNGTSLLLLLSCSCVCPLRLDVLFVWSLSADLGMICLWLRVLVVAGLVVLDRYACNGRNICCGRRRKQLILNQLRHTRTKTQFMRDLCFE